MTNEAKQGCIMATALLCMILFAMLIDAVLVRDTHFLISTVFMESYSTNGS